MSRVLSVAKTWLSLKGEIRIDDEHGQPAYHAVGEFALVPTWRITRDGREVATVRKKPWSWSPTWDIDGELGAFRIERKALSWTRQYRAIGGPLDGALASGSLSDLQLEIRHGLELLAKASGQLLSMQDRHQVEVAGEHELFVVVVMVVLLMDRAQQAAATGG